MLKTIRIARPLGRLIVSNLSEHSLALRMNQKKALTALTSPNSLKFSTSRYRFSQNQDNEKGYEESTLEDEADDSKGGDDQIEGEDVSPDDWIQRRLNDSRDRTRKIPLETSLAYMESAGYKETYGDKKIWELYRRNFPNTTNPNARTRRKCIVFGRVQGGNPCPICRDEYLVVDYRNIKLLRQFLGDYNRQIVSVTRSGVCREQYKKLMIAIEKARDYGYLDVDAEFVEYDYEKYKPKSLSSS